MAKLKGTGRVLPNVRAYQVDDVVRFLTNYFQDKIDGDSPEVGVRLVTQKMNWPRGWETTTRMYLMADMTKGTEILVHSDLTDLLELKTDEVIEAFSHVWEEEYSRQYYLKNIAQELGFEEAETNEQEEVN